MVLRIDDRFKVLCLRENPEFYIPEAEREEANLPVIGAESIPHSHGHKDVTRKIILSNIWLLKRALSPSKLGPH